MEPYFKVGKLYRNRWNTTLLILHHRGFRTYTYSSFNEPDVHVLDGVGNVNVSKHEVVDALTCDGNVLQHMIMTPGVWEEVG